MQILRKIIKILTHLEDLAVFLVCVAAFLIGFYGLYDSYLVYRQANDDSILKYKPGYEGETPDKEIEDNMVAWLTIDGTGIDYPVMQGEDNHEYLNKNPYGEFSLAGSIFLDNRNQADFSDGYSLIYGHHMENGYMFGALDQFLEAYFFREHENGILLVGEKEYEITFLAVLETDATNPIIFSPDTTDPDEILELLKKSGMPVNTDALSKLNGDEKLIALSTCKYPDTIQRTVLVGVV